MSGSRQLVLDASVIIKWHLQDELFVQEALALRSEFTSGLVSILVPDHLRYEVPNAVYVACRRGRLPFEEAHMTVAQFLSWDFAFVSTSDLILRAFTASHRFSCSLYDALYLALAEQQAIPFITADKRLFDTIKDEIPGVTWLGDYRPQATPSPREKRFTVGVTP